MISFIDLIFMDLFHGQRQSLLLYATNLMTWRHLPSKQYLLHYNLVLYQFDRTKSDAHVPLSVWWSEVKCKVNSIHCFYYYYYIHVYDITLYIVDHQCFEQGDTMHRVFTPDPLMVVLFDHPFTDLRGTKMSVKGQTNVAFYQACWKIGLDTRRRVGLLWRNAKKSGGCSGGGRKRGTLKMLDHRDLL